MASAISSVFAAVAAGALMGGWFDPAPVVVDMSLLVLAFSGALAVVRFAEAGS